MSANKLGINYSTRLCQCQVKFEKIGADGLHSSGTAFRQRSLCWLIVPYPDQAPLPSQNLFSLLHAARVLLLRARGCSRHWNDQG